MAPLMIWPLCYNPETNSIDIALTIEDLQKIDNPGRSIFVYKPPTPYDAATFIINVPAQVLVNVPFIMDFTVKSQRFTNIPFWADLIPDDKANPGIEILSIENKTDSPFDRTNSSVLKKGGKGKWIFSKGLQADSVYQLRIMAMATKKGTIQLSTFIPTNPPNMFGPIRFVMDSPHIIMAPSYARTQKNESVIIDVLSNDISSSPLKIISTSIPYRGRIRINSDNTVTYTPNQDFYGTDLFVYTVSDQMGNNATAQVEVEVVNYALQD